MTNSRAERIIHWEKVLSEHEASGLNIGSFCQTANIAKSQYYYWKRRVKEHRGTIHNDATIASEAREFIQVPAFDLVRKRVPETADAVEVRIGSISLVFRSGTDRELFKTAVSLVIEVAG